MADSGPGFGLLVDLRVHAGEVERFRRAILANAEAAVRDEEHCHAFHVTHDESDPERFVLFELYTDAAALEVHKETPHFKRFYEEAGDTIANKTATRLLIE